MASLAESARPAVAAPAAVPRNCLRVISIDFSLSKVPAPERSPGAGFRPNQSLVGSGVLIIPSHQGEALFTNRNLIETRGIWNSHPHDDLHVLGTGIQRLAGSNVDVDRVPHDQIG